MHAKGLGYREAYELLREKGFIDQSPKTRRQVIDYYRYLTQVKAESTNVPHDFITIIDELIDRGLTGKKIASELNRHGMKPLRGAQYNEHIVARYCRSLGVSLRVPNYMSNVRLVEYVTGLHNSGKSCKEITKLVNDAGFRTYGGKEFHYKGILDLLKDLGKESHRNSRSRKIRQAIKSLKEHGCHTRTITRKLNSSGMKTITGKRFKQSHVRHYLRIIVREQGAEDHDRG